MEDIGKKAGLQQFSSSGDSIDGSSIHNEIIKRVSFKGLSAERFQHPVDRATTQALSQLWGLEDLVRQASKMVEEAVYIDNISTSVRVGPSQMGSVHRLLVEACQILDISQVPELYVRQNPQPNAYTLAVQGKRPFIVIHTSLIDLLTPAELQAVIAHELGHLKCDHGVWVTVANLVTLGLLQLGSLGEVLARAVASLLVPWQRAAELTCDRAALLVAQDAEVVTAVLLKLVGGSTWASTAGELSVKEYLNQASDYEAASRTRLGRAIWSQQRQALTHPLPVVRAQELSRWSQSPEFRGIIRRGRPLVQVEVEGEAAGAGQDQGQGTEGPQEGAAK
eukprot:CAMPEP_0113939110 /NCGR_PEP_ID=MMETSP1339-20121228/5495_1 /TAXON_ID=94617 /ORGANISM="Fibrocapsa japonica" /LENGTH=335 /DNA_ID=CAMNT_0000942529 /DNA_START=271 /DNA_END=1276 /DNA_ORIENTATION=- /assembly_acc=CAM_ASM_000762